MYFNEHKKGKITIINSEKYLKGLYFNYYTI